jgi:hypothetical protein
MNLSSGQKGSLADCRTFGLLERYADPFAIRPDDPAMFGADLAVDRQLEDPWQAKGA